MPRLPYAAETLLAQAKSKNKSAKMSPSGDPDGLDVFRTVTFDKASSKYLAPLIEHLGDPRIVDHSVSKDVLSVTFSPRPLADSRDDFPLGDAEAVVKE